MRPVFGMIHYARPDHIQVNVGKALKEVSISGDSRGMITVLPIAHCDFCVGYTPARSGLLSISDYLV